MTKIRCVIFDWAGTTVDHGCFAPVRAFLAAFAERGVALSARQVREPMGLPKRDHLRALLRLPEAGADAVIGTMSELPRLIDALETRGEIPINGYFPTGRKDLLL